MDCRPGDWGLPGAIRGSSSSRNTAVPATGTCWSLCKPGPPHLPRVGRSCPRCSWSRPRVLAGPGAPSEFRQQLRAGRAAGPLFSESGCGHQYPRHRAQEPPPKFLLVGFLPRAPSTASRLPSVPGSPDGYLPNEWYSYYMQWGLGSYPYRLMAWTGFTGTCGMGRI